MSIIFMVGKERFLQEWKNHVSLNPDKHINWMATETGFIAFISNTHEIYCYEHPVQEVPQDMKFLIVKQGEILGIKTFNDTEKTNESLNRLGQILQYNVVRD